MQTNNFLKQHNTLVKSATSFIKKNVKKPIVFATDEQLELEDNYEVFEDLATASYITKYGHYDEFAVVKIEKVKGVVKITAYGTGENGGEVEVSDLIGGHLFIDSTNICYLADMIEKSLK